MDAQRFRALSLRDQALVALAVLTDGREAAGYLEFDADHGVALKRASLDLAALEPDLRMPFVGTLLRAALERLSSNDEQQRD